MTMYVAEALVHFFDERYIDEKTRNKIKLACEKIISQEDSPFDSYVILNSDYKRNSFYNVRLISKQLMRAKGRNQNAALNALHTLCLNKVKNWESPFVNYMFGTNSLQFYLEGDSALVEKEEKEEKQEK